MPSAAEIFAGLLQKNQAAEEAAAAAEFAARVERDRVRWKKERRRAERTHLRREEGASLLQNLGVGNELVGLKAVLEERGAKVSVDLEELTWTYGEILRGPHSNEGKFSDSQRHYRVTIGVVLIGDSSKGWYDDVRKSARQAGILGITGGVKEDAVVVVGENNRTSFVAIRREGFRESLSSVLAQACMEPQKFLKTIYPETSGSYYHEPDIE